ncbi:hypothetical protein F2P45_04480 [Massilia sp. CCM 8733]|uniref:Tetratricopeptide repeat protein n=1 Tax=Massilia mucilaginosa TaxID=2609282 RepID=A0ABX0NNA5_9BURK|nr:tetratricopeptide repeat protein [Massilia mucilaginosa]NHZ88285.1 hypothetical protein [Massilia mucilaginosa]
MFTRYTSTSLLRLAMLGTLAAAGAPACAAMTFDLHVAVNYTGAKRGGVPIPNETHAFKITQGERYLTVQDKKETTIVDLVTRRRYQIDEASRSYVAYSLFDTIGYRLLAIKKKGSFTPTYGLIELENNLSLEVAARTLTESTEGGATVLAVDGVRLASIGAGGTSVSAGDAAMFARVLRTFGTHPRVLARLSAQQRLPASLVTYHKQIEGYSETRTYTISAVKQSAPATYSLAAYKPRAPQGDEIDQVLDKAAISAAPPTPAARQAAERETAQAFADNRLLDAMLGLNEWAFSGGDSIARTAEQRALMKANPELIRLGAIMGDNKTRAELEAANATLQDLRKHTTRKQHVLMLFEADNLKELGRYREAAALYAKALQANPAMASAYGGLGMALYRNEDTVRAWRSWDAGRRISNGGELDLFGNVEQLEKSLVRDYPQFL